jgi:hypothetical protein
MIPRSQHLRDHTPFPISGPGILRIFKETVLKRLFATTASRAHYAGKQPNASIKDHEGSRLSAREDNVADADLLDLGIGIEQPFVEAFEAAAEEGDAGALGYLADAGLSDRGAARCEGEDGQILPGTGRCPPWGGGVGCG